MNTKKLFHPFLTFEEWNQKRIKSLNKEKYNNGYNFAAGVLLRGEETPNSLIGKYKSSRFWNCFDAGIKDAIWHLVRKGVVEDDRV